MKPIREDFNYSLAEALQDLRKKTGKTQQIAADELNVSKTIISNYETGEHKAPAYIVYEYVKEAGMSFDDFFKIVELKMQEKALFHK